MDDLNQFYGIDGNGIVSESVDSFDENYHHGDEFISYTYIFNFNHLCELEVLLSFSIFLRVGCPGTGPTIQGVWGTSVPQKFPYMIFL